MKNISVDGLGRHTNDEVDGEVENYWSQRTILMPDRMGNPYCVTLGGSQSSYMKSHIAVRLRGIVDLISARWIIICEIDPNALDRSSHMTSSLGVRQDEVVLVAPPRPAGSPSAKQSFRE